VQHAPPIGKAFFFSLAPPGPEVGGIPPLPTLIPRVRGIERRAVLGVSLALTMRRARLRPMARATQALLRIEKELIPNAMMRRDVIDLGRQDMLAAR
jgi:hypothetical protein